MLGRFVTEHRIDLLQHRTAVSILGSIASRQEAASMSAYWSIMGDGLVQARGENREGADAIETLYQAINKHRKGNLLDYGCGKGRLANLVAPLNYLGYDVNGTMVEQARRDNPDYTFTHSLVEALSYDADVTLLYTVISMWGGSEALEILCTLRSRIIIIGEIADKRWANTQSALPRIHNRDVADISAMLDRSGYELIQHDKALHERYASWPNDYDKHMHILVYKHERD